MSDRGTDRIKRERAVAVRDASTAEVLDMYLSGDVTPEQAMKVLLRLYGLTPMHPHEYGPWGSRGDGVRVRTCECGAFEAAFSSSRGLTYRLDEQIAALREELAQ